MAITAVASMVGWDEVVYSASAFASKTERGRGQASGGIAGQNEVKWQVSSSSGFCNVGKTGAFNGSAVLEVESRQYPNHVHSHAAFI